METKTWGIESEPQRYSLACLELLKNQEGQPPQGSTGSLEMVRAWALLLRAELTSVGYARPSPL